MSNGPEPRGDKTDRPEIRANGRQDAGGPTNGAQAASGGAYSQGAKSGGQAAPEPSGTFGLKDGPVAPATITFELDGRQVEAQPGETIWAVSKRLGTHIPHLCHKP